MSGWTFKSWYEKSGSALNERRRRKYSSDPSYKERVREVNKKARLKKAKRIAVEKASEKKARKLPVSTPPFRVIEVGSKQNTESLVTIGALAKALGVSVITIRFWERKGLIPKTPFRTKKGDRLYSPKQIEGIREILEIEGKIGKRRKKRTLGPVPCSVRMSNGSVKEMLLFRSGVLAKALGRSSTSIQVMFLEGILPETPLRSKGGHRLFSADMILETCKVLDSLGGEITCSNSSEFHRAVEQSWRKLKLLEAELLFSSGEDHTNKAATRPGESDVEGSQGENERRGKGGSKKAIH